MSIRKPDILDVDVVDAYELRSDGYSAISIYLDSTVISTTSSSSTVVINPAADGGGILYSFDHPVEVDDIVWLHGTSGGGLADGYYTVGSVLTDTSFTVNQPIADSTGGYVQFRYPAGSRKVGFDQRPTIHVKHNNVQQAIEDLDFAITGGGGGGGLDPIIHETLRQLIHLADGIGGPFEGFTTGAYREMLPLGSIRPTLVTWYRDYTKSDKIVQKTITYNSRHLPIVFQWNVYTPPGDILLATVTDTLTYIGGFESSRIRGIIDYGGSTGNLDPSSHKIVRQLIHLADGIGGPFEGFTTGAYREILPSANPFPLSVIWYESSAKTRRIVAKTINYNTNKSVSSVIWKVYDTDGITVLATVSDSINYSGIFETHRTRNVA